MKREVLIKVASIMISKFEDNCKLADMARISGCTYSHTGEIKDILVRHGVIVSTIETTEMYNKHYILTDKGKLIQSNIKDIINILN